MGSRSIKDLDPDVAAKCGEWLNRCNAQGVAVLVYCTYRSVAEQDELYKIGRNVHGKRVPGASIVTHLKGGSSAHNFRRAWDAVPYNAGVLDNKLDWQPFPSRLYEKEFRKSFKLSLLDPHWGVMAHEALVLGIEWGGMWKSLADYCHFQFLAGKTIADYRSGKS